MGSKQSKPKNEGAVSNASKKEQEAQKPIEKVHAAEKQETHYHQKKVKAMDELPTIYVDPTDKEVKVPPGGAKIVFKGNVGQQINLEPDQEPPVKQTRVITTGGYYPGYHPYGGGVIYSVPRSQTVVQNADGTTTTSRVVVVSSPSYYYDPFYGPYYSPYYGYRRYPYYYY